MVHAALTVWIHRTSTPSPFNLNSFWIHRTSTPFPFKSLQKIPLLQAQNNNKGSGLSFLVGFPVTLAACFNRNVLHTKKWAYWQSLETNELRKSPLCSSSSPLPQPHLLLLYNHHCFCHFLLHQRLEERGSKETRFYENYILFLTFSFHVSHPLPWALST